MGTRLVGRQCGGGQRTENPDGEGEYGRRQGDEQVERPRQLLHHQPLPLQPLLELFDLAPGNAAQGKRHHHGHGQRARLEQEVGRANLLPPEVDLGQNVVEHASPSE